VIRREGVIVPRGTLALSLFCSIQCSTWNIKRNRKVWTKLERNNRKTKTERPKETSLKNPSGKEVFHHFAEFSPPKLFSIPLEELVSFQYTTVPLSAPA
jgi:hypothetical protein